MGRLPRLAAALACAVALAPGAASAAVHARTYSSGDLAVPVPDGGAVEQTLSVPDPGPVADVDVRVRLAHPRDGDLTLALTGPDGTRVVLSNRRGGAGADYGRGGAGCAGTPTTFDDDDGDPVRLAAPPFAGTYRPDGFLGAFDGRESQGTWTLRVADRRREEAGTLLCFELVITQVDPTVRTAGSGGVRAQLSYREHDTSFTDVRLTIARGGVTVLEDALGGCPRCEVWVVGERPVKVRDLDGDGEPEVLADLYTGGAHCCAYTRFYRYEAGRYVATRHFWNNAGYRLADLDGNGVPELRSQDDRFAYVFTCYACSAFPPQVWSYRAGRLLDATRRFPALARADARLRWREYLRLRGDPGGDVRGVLAAWAADRALLGELDQAWKRLQAARRRGDLDGFGPGDVWPRGRRYLAELRRFLTQTGYRR